MCVWVGWVVRSERSGGWWCGAGERQVKEGEWEYGYGEGLEWMQEWRSESESERKEKQEEKKIKKKSKKKLRKMCDSMEFWCLHWRSRRPNNDANNNLAFWGGPNHAVTLTKNMDEGLGLWCVSLGLCNPKFFGRSLGLWRL